VHTLAFHPATRIALTALAITVLLLVLAYLGAS
jgi:hypothetical protein